MPYSSGWAQGICSTPPPLPSEDVTFTKALFCACLFTPLTNLPPLYFTPSHIFGLTLCGLKISNEVFLCAFEKLWNATISFGMPVYLFVRPSSARLPTRKNLAPTGRIFMKFYPSVFFENLHRKFKFKKSDKNNGHFTWRLNIHLRSHLDHLFLDCEIFYKEVVEKIIIIIIKTTNCMFHKFFATVEPFTR